jgi:dTDP-glucose 4,6-dehydratase
MSENVLENIEIKQMNDYAISKWVNEMQVLNSAAQFDTESVRVRLFNTYGPGERYSKYRSVICLFCYRALHDIPYTVYRGHKRTSTYISDCANSLASIVGNFKKGEVYNLGGTTYHSIEDVSDMILRQLGKKDRENELVTFADSEILTTKVKQIDSSKARRDLHLENTVTLEEGIANTLAWMKQHYGVS